MGDFTGTPIIEVLVAAGDRVAQGQGLVVVESDKATMEIPSPEEGIVVTVEVAVGDKVSAGSSLLTLKMESGTVGAMDVGLQSSDAGEFSASKTTEAAPSPGRQSIVDPQVPAKRAAAAVPLAHSTPIVPPGVSPTLTNNNTRVFAGPMIRRLARQLGIPLSEVQGSGPRGRVVTEDVHNYVKAQRRDSEPTLGGAREIGTYPGLSLSPWPKVDFSKFGPIEALPLSRIKKLSGAALHRNWVLIPHVTNHDDADVTDLEQFRRELNRDENKGVEVKGKLSPLAFVIKACAVALKAFPAFNASLDGERVILKKYCHIGFAADTPDGLLVPVIRDVDKKGVLQIAREMHELSACARAGKLPLSDMQGGCFTVSSLGGIGGSYFTPIINAPEIAILGTGKMQSRVVWHEGAAAPRLYLPLSLSWDHRIIDGAAAARFNTFLVKLLGDIRRLLL